MVQLDNIGLTPCHYAVAAGKKFFNLAKTMITKALMAPADGRAPSTDAHLSATLQPVRLSSAFEKRFPSVLARHSNIKSKSRTAAPVIVPPLFELATITGDADMLAFLMETQASSDCEHWRIGGVFGVPTVDLLRIAVSTERLDVLAALTQKGDLSLTCPLPNKGAPAYVALVLSAPSIFWVDLILSDVGVLNHMVETSCTVVRQLAVLAARMLPLSEYTESFSIQPNSSLPLSPPLRRMSASTKPTAVVGRSHRNVGQSYDQQALAVGKLAVVLSALAEHTSGDTDKKQGLRLAVLQAALECHSHPAVFATLEKYLAGMHTLPFDDLLRSSRLSTNFCVSAKTGVVILPAQPVGMPKADLNDRNPSLTPPPRSTTPHRGSVKERSLATPTSSSIAPPTGKPRSARAHQGLQGDEAKTPYCRLVAWREAQLVRVVPHVCVDNHGAFLHELCSRRYFCAAAAFLVHLTHSSASADAVPTVRCSELEEESGVAAIHIACEYNAQALLALLLRTAQFSSEEKSREGYFPLHYAARHGHVTTLQQLLALGVPSHCVATDPKTRTESAWGVTPLHLAAKGGHVDACRLLLEYGARIDAKDLQQRTPLHYACVCGQEKAATLLMEQGAVLEREDADGSTPLMLAAMHGFEGLCLKLVQLSRNETLLLSYNSAGGKNVGLAHYAAWYGNVQLLERIITADRNNIRDRRKAAAAPQEATTVQKSQPAVPEKKEAAKDSSAGRLQWLNPPLPVLAEIVAASHRQQASSFRSLQLLGGDIQSKPEDSRVPQPQPEKKMQAVALPCDSWLLSEHARKFVGLGKLRAALGEGNPPTTTSLTKYAAPPPAALAPLAILSRLFTATERQRKKCGDEEALRNVTACARALQRATAANVDTAEPQVPLPSAFIPQYRTSVHVAAEKPVVELTDGRGWQPAHYALANGKGPVIELFGKYNVSAPPDVSMEHPDAQQPQGDDATSSSGQPPKPESAKGPVFPNIDVTLSENLKRKSAAIFNTLHPAPPAPVRENKWWVGYYGRCGDGISSVMSIPPRDHVCTWTYTSSRALFDSRALQSMLWLARRNLVTELAAYVPLVSSIDCPVDKCGFSLLAHAAFLGATDTVKALLKAKARPDRCVRLREKGEPSKGEELGITALHLATFSSSVGAVEALLAEGNASPNIQDECGNTPLHYAACRRNFSVIKVLLHHNAHIGVVNSCGDTAEDVAVLERDLDSSRLLRWWTIATNVSASKDTSVVPPCRSAQEYAQWIEDTHVYYKRLDTLHRAYLELMNHDEEHSVPCLLYNKICSATSSPPARSVLAQLRVYWWPEEVREVNLGGIYLGTQGMATVISLLRVLPRLESLDLSGTKLEHETIVELCRTAESHEGLRKVSVASNKSLGKPSAAKLVELLERNHRIVEVDVTGTIIDIPYQTQIRRLTDRNRKLLSHAYVDKSAVKSPKKESSATASKSPVRVRDPSPSKSPVRDRDPSPVGH